MAAESLESYLAQAACAPDLLDTVSRLARAGHGSEALPLLASHRMQLLAESHAACHRLECIDRAIRIITHG